MGSKVVFNPAPVMAAARHADNKALGRAGGSVRLTARRSIRRSPRASKPGRPPHTQTGFLKTAILYAVDAVRRTVLIGPTLRLIGIVGRTHEAGGTVIHKRRSGPRDDRRYTRIKAVYPPRPFMGPALEKMKDRLPVQWAGSIS